MTGSPFASESPAQRESRLAGAAQPGTTRSFYFSSALYRRKLKARAADRLRGRPPDPWTGNPTAGRFILDGQFIIDGLKLDPGETPFKILPEYEATAQRLHGFSWLRDLKALSSGAARDRARALIRSWQSAHGSWSPFVWRADLMGERITQWLQVSDFLMTEDDPVFARDLIESLTAQTRHLPAALEDLPAGTGQFAALSGLIHGAACLPTCEGLAGAALDMLESVIDAQIMADGGHVERSPSSHLAVLRHLLDIRGILMAARVEAPQTLQQSIDRMAPVLRLYRLGDGGLALFNGSSAERPSDVDAVLALAAFRGRALAAAPHTGFQRLSAGKLALVVDAGSPAPEPYDRRAHAGTLSFELSSGKERLVVNCGAPLVEGPLFEAMRATAAHSALTLDDRNSAEILTSGHLGRKPGQVTVMRRHHEGATWLETAQDGFKGPPFGLHHKRIFFLAPGGEEIRGEDFLQRLPGASDGNAHRACVRFHLHPMAQANLLAGGRGVLIKLASGQGWRFLARGGEVSLEESLYLGEPGHRRKSQQIVLAADTDPGNEEALRLKWAFHREKR
ncbi:MAG: heparinase II/III family protein [Magnetovibrionaceae bacterium]